MTQGLRALLVTSACVACGGPARGPGSAPAPSADASVAPAVVAAEPRDAGQAAGDAGSASATAPVELVMSLAAAMTPRFSADGAHFLVDVGVDGTPERSEGSVAPPTTRGGGTRVDKGRSLVLDGRELFRGAQHITHFAIAPDGAWASFLSSEVLPYEEQKRTGKGTRDLLVHRGKTTDIDGEPAGIAVTPDGAHVAYAVSYSQKDDGAVFLDGKKVGAGFAPRLLTISADGRRWAVANSVDRYGGGETVTIDGVKSGRYHAAWSLVFSPDGKHVAYKAYKAKGTRATVVLDGKELGSYTEVEEDLTFTSAGRLVGRASRGDARFVLLGTKEIPSGQVHQIAIAGDTVAWIDEKVEKGRVVARAFVEGAEAFREDAGAYNPMADRGPGIFGLTLAPSGKRLAFTTSTGVHLVDVGALARSLSVGGERVQPMAFDADGKRLAVQVYAGEGVGIDVVTVNGSVPPVVGPRLQGASQIYRETVRFVPGGVRAFAKRGTDLVRLFVAQ